MYWVLNTDFRQDLGDLAPWLGRVSCFCAFTRLIDFYFRCDKGYIDYKKKNVFFAGWVK